jgi:hypothetical protein
MKTQLSERVFRGISGIEMHICEDKNSTKETN